MSSEVVTLNNRDEIEFFLRQNPYLNIYQIGDLDDPFWQHTQWYGLKESGILRAVVLLYTGLRLPTVLALGGDDDELLRELLGRVRVELPHRFYGHLSPGAEKALQESDRLELHGEHLKMALIDHESLAAIDTSQVERLSEKDREALLDLYDVSYPGHWFEHRMLETGRYYALRRNGVLASAAGTHVYAPRYRVAALGNIATHPDYRGRGYAAIVTARLCLELLRNVDQIGLNVSSDNAAAIRCYEKLGFQTVARYHEYMINGK